jgi:hypothetical protein
MSRWNKKQQVPMSEEEVKERLAYAELRMQQRREMTRSSAEPSSSTSRTHGDGVWAEPLMLAKAKSSAKPRDIGSSSRDSCSSIDSDLKRLKIDSPKEHDGEMEEDVVEEDVVEEEFVVVEEGSSAAGGRRRKRGGKRHNNKGKGEEDKPADFIKQLMQNKELSMEDKKAALLVAAQALHKNDEAEEKNKAEDKTEDKQFSDDDRDGMKSHSQGKLSSTRSHKSKGASHVAKNQARLEKFLQSKGIRPDMQTLEQRRIAAAAASMNLPGTIAVAAQNKMIAEAPVLTEEEREAELVQMLIDTNPLLEPGRMINCDWLQDRQGEPYCTLCEKVAYEMHLLSHTHMMRVEEHSISTMMSGRSNSARRFSSAGMQGVATKASLLSFWGEGLTSLPEEAKARHATGKVIYLDKQSKQILPADVEGYVMHIVSYTGQGKYSRGNQIYAFHDLADADDEDVTGLKPVAPSGQGWWPVIELKLVASARRRFWLEEGFKVVICFYQLQSNPLVSWAIDFGLEEP